VSGVEDGVGNDQTRYRRAADDVGVDDFVDVLGLNASIPDCFGVNHDCWAQFTLVEAAGFVGAHIFNATLSQLSFEQALQFALAGGVAATARVACFALVHADENVLVEFRHSLSLTHGREVNQRQAMKPDQRQRNIYEEKSRTSGKSEVIELVPAAINDLVFIDPNIALASQHIDMRFGGPVGVGLAAVRIAEGQMDAGEFFVL
jgi:hypothetical protein